MKVVLLENSLVGFPKFITNNLELDINNISRSNPLLVFGADLYLANCDKLGEIASLRVEDVDESEDGYLIQSNILFREYLTPFSKLNIVMCPNWETRYE